MCRRSCLPGVYLAVGKLADIPFRDVNFLPYFGCSNICFLDFLISLAKFRLTWRIVAPARRKIARKLGDISKRIEREIHSHYFCKSPHTNTSTTSFFGWTLSTSCAFLRLAVTLVTSCGFLRPDFQLLAFRMFLRVNRKNIALSLLAPACVFLRQPRPQGLLLVQNGGRRNPWPRLLKYATNRGVFCHVTHDEMAFSDVVSSVWRPYLFSAIGNRYSNKTKTFHRVCVTKF